MPFINVAVDTDYIAKELAQDEAALIEFFNSLAHEVHSRGRQKEPTERFKAFAERVADEPWSADAVTLLNLLAANADV